MKIRRDYLNAAEVAVVVGVSRGTIYHWVKAGRLPVPTRLRGCLGVRGGLFWHRDVIDKWADGLPGKWPRRHSLWFEDHRLRGGRVTRWFVRLLHRLVVVADEAEEIGRG